MRRTAVEPAVESVVFTREMRSAAMRTFEIAEYLGRRHLIPRVRALFSEKRGDLFYRFIRAYGFSAFFAIENRYRKSPMALSGNTPVRSVENHLRYSFLAPRGNPFNILDSLNGLVLKCVYGAEPLRCRSENNRIFTSPTVWVLMNYVFGRKQRSALFQIGEYDFV